MKLSLCITTYNRPELTLKSFEKVYNDERVDEIVIVDDHSLQSNWKKLVEFGSIEPLNKIRLFRNASNLGMQRNKAMAIDLAKNEWCILFDSDNIIDPAYLDAFFNHLNYLYSVFGTDEAPSHLIFCPDYAKPNFNYLAYSGSMYNRANAAQWIKYDTFNCLMNTCNYIVNREFYLKVHKYNPDHIASDTIWHNYNHFINDGAFIVVPGMQYFHLVHSGSGFMENADRNIKNGQQVRELIMRL